MAAPSASGSLTAATTCGGGLGIGLVDVPPGESDPRAQNYIVAHVKPGRTFTRALQLCNGTGATAIVTLYAGAATIANGRFTATEGRVGNELSSWITVTPAQVTVPNGGRVIVRATFRVPPRASAGERYAGILAQLPARPRANGVAVASRVGMRAYVTVGPGGAPVSDFLIDSLQASRTAAGLPRVTAAVHNTGKAALDMTGSLTLRNGPGGLSGGPFPATLGTTLAPGDTEPVTIVLAKAIGGGPWTARLTLRSGLLERRAEAQLTFPDEAGQAAPPVKAKNLPLAKDRKVLIPLAGALILLLLLLLLLVGLITSRRKARDKREGDPAATGQ